MGGIRQSPRQAVDSCIAEAAAHASPGDPKEARAIEAFLSTGERNTKEFIPEGNTLEWLNDAQEQKQRRVAALRHLFTLLAKHLPHEARAVPSVTALDVENRVRPMVAGLVQADWQKVALRELGRRVFVLNHDMTLAAMEAEISTTWIGDACRVLWLYFGDYGLAPRGIKLGMEGLSAGTYAHVRPSAQKTEDPYCDVVVHEAAHLLHDLKPANFGLRVKRGQERFLDVRFDCRELFAYVCEAYSYVSKSAGRKARIDLAERFLRGSTSFPKQGRKQIAEIVVAAARSRIGWTVIREAVLERRPRSLKVSPVP